MPARPPSESRGRAVTKEEAAAAMASARAHAGFSWGGARQLIFVTGNKFWVWAMSSMHAFVLGAAYERAVPLRARLPEQGSPR